MIVGIVVKRILLNGKKAEGILIQYNFAQSEIDYNYWKELCLNKGMYEQKKREIAQQAME